MMRINVAQLLKQAVGEVRHYTIDDSTDEGFPVTGEVKLLRTNRSILATGRLHTEVSSVCSRCLEPLQQPLTLDLEDEYFPTKDVITGAPLPVPEDGGFAISDDHILDLNEAVRQYTLITSPMKPVCRADCAGLCPHCGANLNQGPCQCIPQHQEAPLSKLRTLLEERR